ncbi:MAG TPA: TonB-dependent siderophore receptor [Nevskiaceae bacterium]
MSRVDTLGTAAMRAACLPGLRWCAKCSSAWLFGGLVMAWAPLASAQDASRQGGSAPDATLGPVTVYGQRPAGYLAEDTLTATHTDTPLVDVPLSIQVIPEKLFQDQGAQSLADVVRNAPGVSVHQGEGNRDQFVIRGVSTKSDFFVDGLRDDSEYFRDLYNVSSVDVLQGPSALLFGRGNAGGVINLVTKQAQLRPVRHLDFTTGSFGELRGTADYDQMLGANAAFRVNGVYENSGGFREYSFLHRYGLNPTLAFGLGTDTRLFVGVQDFHERRFADRGIPSAGGRPADVSRELFFGSPSQNVAKAHVDDLNLRLEHDFSDRLEFRNALRVSRNNKYYRNLFPGGSVAADDTVKLSGYEHHNVRRTYTDQAEFAGRFDTAALKHEVLVGADFSWQVDDDRRNNANPATYASAVPLTNPTVSNALFDIPSRDNHVTGREWGLYAQDQVSWGEHWKAIGGVRWDHFSLNGVYHDVNDPSQPAAIGHRNDAAWSPRAGLIYKPVENDSLYLSYTRTFTPTGANLAISCKSPADCDIAPQTANGYEFGNKLDLLQDRLSLTAAVFQLDLQNVPAPAPDGSGNTVLTGAQRMRGVELTAIGHVTPKLDVSATYTWMTAEITKATSSAAAGTQVPLVPRNQFSVWSSYALTEHWGFGGGLRGQSRSFASLTNAVALPGYVTADAMAYWQSGTRAGDWRVQLNVDNLLNNYYYDTANGDNQIMPGAPLRVLASFGVNF